MTDKVEAKNKGGFGYPLLGDGWWDARKCPKDMDKDYLVYVQENCSGRKYIVIGDYHDGIWWPTNIHKYHKVLAWCKLPDPPAFA